MSLTGAHTATLNCAPFQRAQDALAEAEARVVALSVDDEAATAELIAKHGLTFPVGYGADSADSANTP